MREILWYSLFSTLILLDPLMTTYYIIVKLMMVDMETVPLMAYSNLFF